MNQFNWYVHQQILHWYHYGLSCPFTIPAYFALHPFSLTFLSASDWPVQRSRSRH